MYNKTILILSDGMRPDAVAQCGHPTAKRFCEECSYSLSMQTVMPSVTLPCHMSLFHSVPADRHGILGNTYHEMVRPVNGIFEVLRSAGKANGIFYNWEELRDLARPDKISHGFYFSGHTYGYKDANVVVTDACIDYINKYSPDFVFLYLGETDAVGHNNGWMSEEYMNAVNRAWDMIEKVDSSINGYNIIVTADHGGSGRGHGSDSSEDMTIPFFLKGEGIIPAQFEGGSILDIAPTVTKLCGVQPDPEWEGKTLI